jgi:hypothetical protein
MAWDASARQDGMKRSAYLEEDIVESPCLGGQHARKSLFALFHEQNKVDGARARITGCPRFSGTRIRSMSVRPQGLAVYPRLRDSIYRLVTVETEEFGDDSCRCYFYQDDVVKADTVEGVEECEGTLDFVGLYHTFDNVFDCERLALTRQMVSDGEDGAEIVGWMTPCVRVSSMCRVDILDDGTLCSQETVVEIEPANDGANVERAADGIELVGSSGDLRTCGKISTENGPW